MLRALAEALAGFFGLVVVNLRRDNVDPEVIALIPEAMAREQLAIPVRFEEDGLYVAVAEPSDELRSLLATTSKRQVNLMIAPMSDIIWAIDSNYRAIGSVGNARPGLRGRGGCSARSPSARAKWRSSVTTHPSSRWSTGSSSRPCATARRTFTSSRPKSTCGFVFASTARSKRSSNCPSRSVRDS